MKYLVFLLFSSSLLAADQCPKDLVIEGQIKSYEKVQGKVVPKTFYATLEDDLSEHMGDFKNIRIPKKFGYKSLSIADEEFPLKEKGEYLETINLKLTRKLIQKKMQKVDLKFNKKDKSCSRNFRGIAGD